MTFSIVVPVYNTEKYVAECVESLLAQTFSGNYEILLINDGSTDNSSKICDEYAILYPEKVRVFNKENEGPFLTRCAGIKMAQGEYCLFVDSDDFWDSDLLDNLYSCILKYPNVDVIGFSLKYFSDGKFTSGYVSELKDGYLYHDDELKQIYEALLKGNDLVSFCTKAVRTSILKNDDTNYYLYKDKRWGEDWFMSLYSVTYAKEVVYISKQLYNYRIINNSLTRSFSIDSLNCKNLMFVYDRYKNYLPLWGFDDEEHYLKLDARFFNQVIYTFCEFYKYAKSFSNKKALFEYNWDSMLPENCINYCSNKYENPLYRKIYTLIKCKKYFNLIFILYKKKLNDRFKKLKKQLISKG